jgi:hypothetical protein
MLLSEREWQKGLCLDAKKINSNLYVSVSETLENEQDVYVLFTQLNF